MSHATANVPNVVMECLQCGWQDKEYQTVDCPNCKVMLASLYYSPTDRCQECLFSKAKYRQIYELADPVTGVIAFDVVSAQQWIDGPEYKGPEMGGEALPMPNNLVLDLLRVNVTEPRHYPHVTNPEEPGILVQIQYTSGDVSHVLIDGSHRAAIKMKEKKKFFAHILPWEWGKRFVISHRPGSQYQVRW
jgi:hypothetical protein